MIGVNAVQFFCYPTCQALDILKRLGYQSLLQHMADRQKLILIFMETFSLFNIQLLFILIDFKLHLCLPGRIPQTVFFQFRFCCQQHIKKQKNIESYHPGH